MTLTSSPLPSESDKAARRLSLLKAGAFLLLKLGVTVGCLWYVARQIDFASLVQAADTLDSWWAFAAVLALLAQVPLAALRWSNIVDAMDAGERHTPRRSMIAITWMGLVVGQVLPNVTGDTIRMWFLTRLRYSWSLSVVSVLIDRGLGVLVLFSMSFGALLLPSALSDLGGFRGVALLVLGTAVCFALLALAFAPAAASLLRQSTWTRWLGEALITTHEVLFKSSTKGRIFSLALAVHVFTIVAIWLLSNALALGFTLADAAVLFAVMIAVTLFPVSVNGWGVRELTVAALLTNFGISQEAAILFSVCFGLTQIIAALPGAVLFAIYRSPSADMPTHRKP